MLFSLDGSLLASLLGAQYSLSVPSDRLVSLRTHYSAEMDKPPGRDLMARHDHGPGAVCS